MSLSEQFIINNERRWKDAEIENLQDSDRRMLAVYNPSLTKTGISENLRSLIKERGFTPADGIYAASLRHMKKTLSLSSVTPGEAAVQGGHIIVDNDNVTVVKTTGVQTLPNTPILGHMDEPDLRDNLDTLTAICCSIVRVSKGIWVDNRSQEWSDHYAVSSAGMKKLAEAMVYVLTKSELWTSMSTIARQGVTGIPQMRFVRRVLNALPKSDYDLLNNIVVVDALEVIKPGRKSTWLKTVDAKGQPAVPEKTYEMRAFTAKDKAAVRTYPCVFTYRGGFVPPVRPFSSSPDTSSTTAMASFNREVSQWVQGATSAISILASGKGYATQLTENTKRQLFLISATLSSWTYGEPVVIRLPSLGDFVPVLSSIQYWQAKILDLKPEMFVKIREYSDGEDKPWFKFVLPNQSQIINNPQVMAHCTTRPEATWTTVFVMDPSLPQKSDKTQQDPDWDTYSFTAYPTHLGDKYIGICTIFGPAFFPADSAMEKQLKGKSVSNCKPLVGCHVYSHGLAKDFQGIISSFPNLKLVGRKLIEIVGSEKEISKVEDWISVPIQACETRAVWYDRVKRDLYSMFEFPWRPVVRSSPIVNLLFVTKGKAELNTSMWMAESGSAYVGKVFAPPQGSNIVFSAPAADPNAPVDDDDDEVEDDSAEEEGDDQGVPFVFGDAVPPKDKKEKNKGASPPATTMAGVSEKGLTTTTTTTKMADVEEKKVERPKKMKQQTFKEEGDEQNLDLSFLSSVAGDLGS